MTFTSLVLACGGSTTNDVGGGAGGAGGAGAAGGAVGTGGTGSGGTTATGCKLEVESAGSLPGAVFDGARLSGPAIAATADGFMLGYRDQDGDSMRAVLAFLKDDGALSPAQNFDLSGCANQVPEDGVGMAFAGTSGMMTTSLPDCGQGAGAVFIPFNSKGQVEQAVGPRNKSFKQLWMSQSGAIAPAAGNDDWELVYRVQHQADSPSVERLVLEGSAFKTSVPIAKPFGDADVAYTMVATSPQVRTFLAPVQSGGEGTTVVKVGDRSSDTLDLSHELSLPRAAPWAALVAWNDKIAAAIPATVGMTVQPAVWKLGAISPTVSMQIGKGTVMGGALVVLRDHLFVVQARSGGISVYRLDGADGSLAAGPAVSMDFAGSLGTMNLSAFDGTRIAAAAARDRVAVTWLTKPSADSALPIGGWALLRCAK